jgi:hypothetical protein
MKRETQGKEQFEIQDGRGGVYVYKLFDGVVLRAAVNTEGHEHDFISLP